MNTCTKKVPKEYLDQIEQGVSLETLEKMMSKNFDVFKYKTQITIHGIFSDLTTRRVGGYVNLTQNQNRSIGIRYNAIDYEKKKRLFSMLKTLGIWYAERNSQNYLIYKMQCIDSGSKAEILAAVAKYEEEAKTINRDLFVGNVYCNLQQDMWGRIYVVLTCNICCFYEKNFSALFTNLSGMTLEDGEKKCAEILEKEKREREERDREYEIKRAQWREEEEKKKAEILERKKQFILDNPLNGYELRENYLPRIGDVIAYVHYEKYGDKFEWRFRSCKKSFGKLQASRCNEKGEKIQSWGDKAKHIAEPIGKIYVRIAA